MSKFTKIVFKLLSGTSDANFSFEDLRTLLLALGFHEERQEEVIRYLPKIMLLKSSTFNQKDQRQSLIRLNRLEK